MAYLSYMAERLAEMKRLLKPTGSIYLHCDPTMSHYLKALMDEIFGYQNFRNEVVWKRFGSHNDAKKCFGNIHDILLFYVGGPKAIFKKTYQPYSKEYIKSAYLYKDNRGRYGTSPLQARSLSGGGYDYTYKGISDTWKFPKERLEELDRDGYIHWPKTGKIPRRKVYLHLMKGTPTQDVITDIKPLSSSHKERLGYPTQKPISLLERIIEASSNPGDIVLDPFCGCGTAIEAAYKLGRSWLGIDISPFAIDLVQKVRMKGIPIEVRGVPEDIPGAQKLASEAPFEFEKWAISRIPGLAPNAKQRGDGGIDGRGLLLNEPDDNDSKLVLAQTKGGKFNASNLRDFLHVIERDRAAMGVYITLSPVNSPNAHAQAIQRGIIHFGASRYPRAQLWSIHDYFKGKHPNIPPLADPYTGKAMQPSLF